MGQDTAGRPVARVLICEDSRTFATALRRYLEQDGDLHVVGTVTSGEEAVGAVARLRPDLVTMDIELPGVDGIETTKRILATHRVAIVVVSSYTPRGSERAAAALAAGAVDVLAKSYVRVEAPSGAAAVALRLRLGRLARAYARQGVRGVGGPATAVPVRPAPGAAAVRRERRAEVVAIGASTGGPQALLAVLSALPAGYSVPVLVVQHMSSGFTPGLVRWLDQQVALPVALATEGSPLRPGVWFAPDDAHLVLDDSLHLHLDTTTDAGVHRPAVNLLLETAARALGRGAVGVVLTGMGRDGAEGVAAVRAAGGLTIAQDESTSVVWGMPRAAIESGAELVLPLQQIGPTLGTLVANGHAR